MHVDHLGLACSELLHHHPDKFLGDVYDQFLDRLHQFALDALGHNFWFAYHQFVTLSAHHFDQDGKLQLATPHHFERICAPGSFHANGDVGQQFFVQPLAQISRGDVASFPA